jgi:HSP20 family protein
MAIVRWDPVKDLMSIQERINKVFDNTFNNDSSSTKGEWAPPVDIYETENEIVLAAEIPGMTEEDLDIQISDGILTLKGEKKLPLDYKSDNFHRLERPYGKFVRSFALPTNLDLNSIKAKLKDGILKISLNKDSKSKPTIIKVTKED